MTPMNYTATWIQTAYGAVDLLEPRPEQVRYYDILEALPKLVRFNGHTPGVRYDVAHHSCYVSIYLEQEGYSDEVQWAGLWHDAHEAYTGDIPSPVKAALRVLSSQGQACPLRMLEAELDTAIARRFVLNRLHHPAVKYADQVLAEAEHVSFQRPTPEGWGPWGPWGDDVREEAYQMRVHASDEETSRNMFRRRAEALARRLGLVYVLEDA